MLLMRMKKEDFEQVIDTNLVGTFNVTKNVVPYMMKARSGRIFHLLLEFQVMQVKQIILHQKQELSDLQRV